MTQERRPACARCLRPARACICAAACQVRHTAQVLILMHPLEERHAKGTGRLLHLCLGHSRVLVGEAFEPQELARALTQPWDEADTAAPRRALLLYPPTSVGGSLPVAEAPALPPKWLDEPQRLRLVVLDATWRKSRRMLWASPLLQSLPRLALQQPPPSRYTERKAHAPHQRSTLEAIWHALARLEPGNANLAALGDAMDALMQQQARLRLQARSAMLGPPSS